MSKSSIKRNNPSPDARLKGYRFLLLPSSEQINLIERTFGCCRKVWNLMLDERETEYKQHKKTVKPTPAKYKTEFPYLKEVDSLALCNVQKNLENAYQSFFKGNTKHPKFKSKKASHQSFTTNNQHGSINVKDGKVRLPKLGEIRFKEHRSVPDDYVIKSATVSKAPDGKYYISLIGETVVTVEPKEIKYAIGMDYASGRLYVTSDGEVGAPPKSYRNGLGKIKKEQRKLSRKVPGSKNFQKQKTKLAGVSAHVANQRSDFLHKDSLAKAKLYDLVVIEDLDMREILKGHGSSAYHKVTLDNAWGTYVRFLEYKLIDRGGQLIKVDRFFPSSQLCHVCGYKNPVLKDDSIRKWICLNCGEEHNRDLNSALNILREGLRIYNTTRLS